MLINVVYTKLFTGSQFVMKRAAEQIIGREGETATLLSRCPFTLNLRVFGFAPRQLNRSVLREIAVTKLVCAVFVLIRVMFIF